MWASGLHVKAQPVCVIEVKWGEERTYSVHSSLGHFFTPRTWCRTTTGSQPCVGRGTVLGWSRACGKVVSLLLRSVLLSPWEPARSLLSPWALHRVQASPGWIRSSSECSAPEFRISHLSLKYCRPHPVHRRTVHSSPSDLPASPGQGEKGPSTSHPSCCSSQFPSSSPSLTPQMISSLEEAPIPVIFRTY